MWLAFWKGTGAINVLCGGSGASGAGDNPNSLLQPLRDGLSELLAAHCVAPPAPLHSWTGRHSARVRTPEHPCRGVPAALVSPAALMSPSPGHPARPGVGRGQETFPGDCLCVPPCWWGQDSRASPSQPTEWSSNHSHKTRAWEGKFFFSGNIPYILIYVLLFGRLSKLCMYP